MTIAALILMLLLCIASTWLIGYTVLELLSSRQERKRQEAEDRKRFRLMMERGPLQ